MNNPAPDDPDSKTNLEFERTQVIDTSVTQANLQRDSSTEPMSRQAQASGEPVLSARGITKRFQQGDLDVPVLENLDMSVAAGERVAIVGSSGSGKSTLLHLLGGLDSPSTGEIEVAGERMEKLSPAARGRLRNRVMGFVYQFHHLLPEFTAVENVAMPLMIGGEGKSSATKQAKELLERVGLADRYRHKPGELSGGERQRAAIARALINKPRIVLADEPTGNLDEATSSKVYELMLELNRELQTSFIVVTHDIRLAARMDRTLAMQRGALTEMPTSLDTPEVR